MTLQQTIDERLKELDKDWKNGLIIAFGYKNPDSGMQRKVVAEQVYFNLKHFISESMRIAGERAVKIAKAREKAEDLEVWEKLKKQI